MSPIFSIHDATSIELTATCGHSDGSKSFTFIIPTESDFFGKDRAEFAIFVKPDFIPKMERIAAAIAEIMASDVNPALLAIAAE